MLQKLPVNFEKDSGFILTSKLKMVLYLVTIMFLVFIIMNAVFSKMYSENVKEIVLREFQNKVEQTCRYIDLIAEKVETTSEIVFTNQMVQDQAIAKTTGNPQEILDRMNLFAFLQGVAFTIEEVNSIDLYLNEKRILFPSDQGVYSGLKHELADWYRHLEQNDQIVWTDNYGKKLESLLRPRPVNQLTMVRPLVSTITGEKVGLIAINLEKRVIMDLLSSDVDANYILISKSGKIIVSSLNNQYEYEEIKKNIAKIKQMLRKGRYFGKINGLNSIFVSRVSSYTGWELITFAPIGPSLMKISRIRNYVLLFLVTNFAVISLIILVVSKKMFDPVNKLISFMKKVEQGNLNVVIEDERKDEFGYIYSNFNRMVANIKYLFQELYEQKLLKKDAELKLLQSKINPHFIYNIFNNMSWLLELERYQDLREMIDAVAKYHKTSLNYGGDFIKISDNIEQLESYAKIQMIRFKNKFRCDFRVDPKTLENKIPIFILQPLLENAICHGVEPKEDFGLIRVTVKRNKDKLTCIIEDNGIGIEKEKLAEIRKNINDETMDSNRYFALANVNRRIKLQYGPEYGLTIVSKKGRGTKVTVKMPLSSEMEAKPVV